MSLKLLTTFSKSLLLASLLLLSACSFEDTSSDTTISELNTTLDENTSTLIISNDDNITSSDTNTSDTNSTDTNTTTTVITQLNADVEIPSLVVIMNWDDYYEDDPSLWYDKIFNPNVNSVNTYYSEMTNSQRAFRPIEETSGNINDGIIMVAMNKSHPGGFDDTSFRDTEITNAITSPEVVDSVDFALLDTNGDGDISAKELQIIFIVAGGEESFGDDPSFSIWAYAWSYASDSAPVVDGVNVMRYTGDENTSGSYLRFGANHGDHKATIGIIAHELGHSAFNLQDYYDDGGGSGLGSYDLMSGGSWSRSVSDTYEGETPSQLSVYNKIDAGLDVNVREVNSSVDINITCSSGEFIKLVTSIETEYFLVECRDSAKENSDISFNYDDNTFTEDRLFLTMYHVDDNKTDNTEDGVQNDTNHYKLALVEKNATQLLTNTVNLSSEFADVYTLGDKLTTGEIQLYDTSDTNYSVEVLTEDYTNRTMIVRIVK